MIARLVRDELAKQARLTRAHERATVLGRDEETGNTLVSYRGVEITLAGAEQGHWAEGQSMLVERSNAGLQSGGRSAYGRR